MKKIYTLCLGILITFSASSQAIAWQKVYVGSYNTDVAHSIQQTFDGGYIVAGAKGGYPDQPPNVGDFWILKLNSQGNIEWQKTFGGSSRDGARSVQQTSDGGYIAAGFTYSNDGDVSGNNGGSFGFSTDYWIVKLDANGNIEWQKCLGGSQNEVAYSIIETPDGNYVVAGFTDSGDGQVTLNPTVSSLWVVKLSSLGSIIWDKCFGLSSGIKVEYSCSIINSNDNGLTIVVEYSDYRVLKLDSLGNLQWDKVFGGSAVDFATEVKSTSDNGYVVIGWTASNNGDVTLNNGFVDYWLVKLDSVGTLQWEKCYGGTGIDSALTVAQTLDNGYIIGGYSNSVDGQVTGNHGNGDMWIVKVDSIGTKEWSRSLGGSQLDHGRSIIETSEGDIVAVGQTKSSDGDLPSGITGVWTGAFWIVKLTENFNSIVGKAFVDLNSNFIQDAGELSIKNHKIIETNTNRFTLTKSDGNFNLSVLDTNNFNISTSPLIHYASTPLLHSANFNSFQQIDSLNDFAFQPIGTFDDLQINVTPLTAFRPGFNAIYNISYKNIGTTTSATGTVHLKLGQYLSFVSSDIMPSSQTFDSISWNISSLLPYQEENILVVVNVHNLAILTSTINSTAIVEPITGDATPLNNESTWPVTVTGSFDPNDILVNRETVTTTELVSPPYLDYLIRFQNTGTDTAFTVKIKNPLPVNAQLYTFEFLESSHPTQLNYSNAEQLMWFQFDNILLPDSNTNELLSHGYVRYRIKPQSTLVVGDLIENSASIFFDFNAPIYTNTAVTEIVLPSSVPGIKNNFDFSIFPNPSTGEVNISFTLKEEKAIKIELFNSLGQVVKTLSQKKFIAGKNQINFSTENLSKGIYHIKFFVDENVVTRKLVKM